jgi:hypothetical protein
MATCICQGRMPFCVFLVFFSFWYFIISVLGIVFRVPLEFGTESWCSPVQISEHLVSEKTEFQMNGNDIAFFFLMLWSTPSNFLYWVNLAFALEAYLSMGWIGAQRASEEAPHGAPQPLVYILYATPRVHHLSYQGRRQLKNNPLTSLRPPTISTMGPNEPISPYFQLRIRCGIEFYKVLYFQLITIRKIYLAKYFCGLYGYLHAVFFAPQYNCISE